MISERVCVIVADAIVLIVNVTTFRDAGGVHARSRLVSRILQDSESYILELNIMCNSIH